MALTQGGFQAYDFNRMVVLFTMMNDKTEVPCAISTDAMDRLEGSTRITPEQREQQFLRLRERIEERASRKFIDVELEGNPPGVILRSIEFARRSPDASRGRHPRDRIIEDSVMPGLVPGIQPSFLVIAKDVDGRDKPGHDRFLSSHADFLFGFLLRLRFRPRLRLRLFRHIRKHHVVARRVQIRFIVLQARDDAIDIRNKIAAQPHHVRLARLLLLRGALLRERTVPAHERQRDEQSRAQVNSRVKSSLIH